MTQYLRNLMALKSDRRAVTALEYGLIAALIAVVIVGSVTALGTAISKQFNSIANTISTATK
jgi:pilus assembly protein Flp/PilA